MQEASNLKVSARTLLIVTYVPPFVILAIVLAVSLGLSINFGLMTRDVAAIAKVHPLAGVLSSLGVLLWCVAASSCFLAAAIVHNSPERGSLRFLLASGFLSTYLLLDDFFLFHEELAPRYLHLNEKLVFAGLGLAVIAYLMMFWRTLLQTRWYLFGLALGFLGLSAFVDVVLPRVLDLGHWQAFFEDGTKWIGIASWCAYFVVTSYENLLGVSPIRAAAASRDPELTLAESGASELSLRPISNFLRNT